MYRRAETRLQAGTEEPEAREKEHRERRSCARTRGLSAVGKQALGGMAHSTYWL